ncbi:MAG: hypothetical protein K8R36_20825 [Planctomycetales bacterium]|nr:hypothetical protein [Planctomycetales bacterium]
MEFIYRPLRRLSHWWEMLWFRRRWNRLYDKAVRIEGVANIYLTVYGEQTRQTIQDNTLRVWERIPQEARAALANHWKRLQRSWDGRKTGIRLHLPIYGVFDSGFETAADYGNLIGKAFKSQQWSDYNDSPDSLMNLFAGMFLVLYDSQMTPKELDLHIARRFDKTDELLSEWGFAEELAKEERL